MLTRYRYSSLREGLVGHWRPSRGCTGNTLIDSVRGNHGTLTNGPTWHASGSGLALSFDGSNDYVLLPTYTYFTGSTPYSICGWFNLASLGVSYPMVFSNNGQIEVRMNSTTGRLEYLNGGSQGTAANAVSLNVWYSFALTWNGSTISLHQNGVTVASAAFSSSISPSMTTTIGGRSASFPWPGLVDDLAIYSRGLTQSEALTLYTAGRGALDQRVNVPVVRGFTASGAYTLACDHATFTETGQDVGLTASRRLTTDQATYAETGQDADVLARRLLTSENASYTVSGQDATFTATGSLVGGVGTFALSGQDANLFRGRTLTADFGAFVSTGQDASLARSRIIQADQTAFALSGQDATLTKTGQASLAADYVTFSVLGQDATLTYSNAPNVPYLELDFASNNAATGTLTATSATSSLVALQATGTLVVTDTET